MWFAIKLGLAGLGHLIADWSVGLVIIAVCVVLEFGASFVETEIPFIKPFVEWIQKYILYVGIGAALVLFGEWRGAADMSTRCDAKAAVVENHVHTVVIRANKPSNVKKYQTDQ